MRGFGRYSAGRARRSLERQEQREERKRKKGEEEEETDEREEGSEVFLRRGRWGFYHPISTALCAKIMAVGRNQRPLMRPWGGRDAPPSTTEEAGAGIAIAIPFFGSLAKGEWG